MCATALAANPSTTSAAKQIRSGLLLSVLLVAATLSAWAQNITVSPARVTFPKTVVGVTSGFKAVTIANKGGSAQAVNLVTSGDFSETDNCGGSIAAGKSCKVNIYFTPTQVGSISGATGIYDNSNNLLAFVGLAGSGIAPVTTAPAGLSFTSGTIGTQSATQTFQIVNNTSSTVHITGITTNVPDYQIGTGTCLTTPLAAAGSCTVSVQVTPTSAVDDGAIIVTDDAPNAVPQVVKLTSSAKAGTAPISLSKTSLTFTTPSGATSAPQTVTVTNSSSATVTLGTITATADYVISGTTCTSSLAAKGKCTFSIEFQPAFVGIIQGTAAVPFTTSNSNSPLVVNLTGTSLAPISFAPAKLTFSSQAVGTISAAQSVAITNNSASAVTLNSVVPSADFQIQSSGTTCPLTGGSLAAGSACTVEIQFAPTVVGGIGGALTVTNSASPNPLLLPLAGTGAAGAGNFTLTAAPSSLSIAQGSSGTSTITVNPLNGFNGSVSLAVTSALPSGVTASFNPSSTTTTSTLTLTASGSAAVGGPTTVTITGTSGSLTQTTTVSLTVTVAPNFTLSAAPSSLSIAQGSSGTSTITVNPLNGFNGSVSLAVTSALPSGVTASFNPPSTTTTSTLTLTASGSAAVGGPTTVTITGTSGSLTQTTTISLTVTSVPNFTLSASPNSLSIAQGSSGTSTITVNPLNGFNGSVSLTVTSTLPSGVTASFNPSSTTTTSTLTLTASGSAAAGGPTTVTITGTSGSLTQTTTISLTVTAVGPSAVLNPASAHQGSTETIVITGTGTNFAPGTTANFGADITTGTLIVNGPTSASVPITIDNVAALGARTVTITSGSKTVNATFTVMAGVPAITVINANTIAPSATESVSVTGVFTNWVQGTTKANFGPGISVGGAPAGTFGPVSVGSGTALAATLTTSGAAIGYRTVQIQTGSQILTVNNGMFVANCTSTPPAVLQVSPVNGAVNAPVNTLIQAQFNVPMNRSTFTLNNSGSGTVFFYDANNPAQGVPGTLTVDASGTIMTIAPNASLAAGDQFFLSLSNSKPYVQDSCGNSLPFEQYSFNAAFNVDTAGPTLTGTSPLNADTNIPLSGNSGATPVVLQFNTPIDPITAQTGFSMQSGANMVSGNFTYSPDDATVTFTPVTPLTASTSYTVTYNAQITDAAGDSLTNPGSISFTTGSAGDTAAPSVTLVDPPNGAFGVGLNVTPHLTFSEPVDALTIPAALSLVYADSGVMIPATVTVAANRLSATLTPSAPLLPNTYYTVNLAASGYSDLAGNLGSGSSTSFYTGATADTNSGTVVTINPGNAQTAVPLNARISALMSKSIDSTTVTNSSITVTPAGGSAIAGTVKLASDGVTLTFVPSSALTASTIYYVSVGGFNDIDGNPVTTFASSFTTGTGSYGSGSFTVVSTSPSASATNVPVTSPVTFTLSNLINAASVNPNTFYVNVNNSGVVAGSYSVSGASVTFTPLTQYPANTLMNMTVCNLTDEAGNSVCAGYTFTTANTADNTPPTVTISPANGATNVGLNTQVVLSFSESMNPSAITTNAVALLSGDTALSYGYSISRDNRTIVLNPGGTAFTPGATITVELSSGVRDLSGNALANTSSQFTLTTELPNTQPAVDAMRPGSGATNVPANTVVTLFTSAAMNPATIPGALHVTDNGVVITGTTQLFSNGQAIEFTPGNSFGAGDSIQAYLDSSALSADGVPLQSFNGQFTVANSLKTQASVQATNPISDSTNVPLNTVIQIEYNQSLQPNTINSTNVALYQFSTGTFLNPALSLVGNGQVINIAPTSNLVAGSKYAAYINYGGNVTNTKGVAVQGFELDFTAGSAVDNAVATIVSMAPTNNSTNIGTNALVSVNFNKAINPVSVTGSTIQLSAGSTTEVPSSISFSPDFTRVSITPLAPLPPSTQMTVTINGVTSVAGKAVATTTTNFTTAAQPDFNHAYVVNPSVQNGQTNVPVNSVFTMQFSKPMDVGSLNVATVGVFANTCGDGIVPATVSWSPDQTTISIVPTGALAVGAPYYLSSDSLMDLAGNLQQTFCNSFTTSFSPNTNPPAVINTSPENTQTQVPVNSPVQILFSEPINPTTVAQVTLQTGGNAVAVTPTFTAANQLLTLTPALPLLANANYTLTITGVKDTAGNPMTATVTNTFTTGPTFNVLNPSVIRTDPPNAAIGIGTNVTPHLVFNERLNPLSVVSSAAELYYNGSVQLFDYTTGQWVPATVSMSADRLTATITPKSLLQPNSYYVIYAGANAPYYDVAGNAGVSYLGNFLTGLGPDAAHTTVSTISPVNAQTGAPLNTQIFAVMSDDIDPTTVTNSSITVTPSGGSAIAGTVTLANDGVTLTFVPGAALTASTVYNVSVGGFNDVEGNSVTAFTSSFTTGTASYGAGTFTVASTNPANGATNVSVTSPVTFNMTNLIDVASVNSITVEVRVFSSQAVVAGTYSVSGASVTFTPLTPYPANTQMGMYVNGIMDEAGNNVGTGPGTFTTASTVDHTAPTVAFTPANGTTNAGLNTQVVLTFSKSINPATITSSSVNLLNGDVPLNPTTSISRDNRTVVLNYTSSILPAGATITATATNLITDLSGNALASATSQFTTTPAVSNTAPYVIGMRPGNGATAVPANTVITLFIGAPMNAGSLTGALHVSQNGVLVSGTTNVGSNGQSVEFTPASALSAGASIQVVLDSTAQDLYGNYLQSFTGSFTVAGSLTNTQALVQAVNPFPNAANVPLNTVIQIEYNQPLKASTVNNTNVVLYEYSSGTFLTPTLSLSANGQVITIAPTSNLMAGSGYYAYVSYSAGIVTNIDGVPVQPYQLNFIAGTATDSVAPTILTVAPPDASTGIGTNASVSVDFSKAVNPVSVTGSSIQLSGGSVTEVPSSISFSPDYARTIIVPQAPLPSSTQMAIAINGVTSEAGTAAASQTTHFTTMAGADFVAPYVVNSSVQTGQTVGTNAAFAIQFNKPIDLGSLDGAAVGVSSFFCGVGPQFQAQATLSWSADQTTVFIAPTGPLSASTSYYLYSYSLTDRSGNAQQNFCVSFLTGSGTDSTGATVLQVSPPSGLTGVPINAPVQVLFSEPISAAVLGGVTLKQGSTVVPVTVSLYDGDRGIQLLPQVPLATATVYTINVTGVVDITGNPQSNFPSQSFTTGAGIGLVAPTVVSTNPANGATKVPDNTTIQVVFNEAMDPASFDPNNSFTLHDPSSNVVPATITFSADYKTATLHPASNLTSGATYTMYVGSNNPPLQDLGGNKGISTSFSFTAQ